MLVSDYAILSSYGSSTTFFAGSMALRDTPHHVSSLADNARINLHPGVEFTASSGRVFLTVEQQRMMMKALRSSVRVIARR